VYEAGPLGYVLYRRLRELGIEGYVSAPECLEQGRRKFNKLDGRKLCGRLYSYVQGDRQMMRVVRVPSEQEEQWRAQSRQYDQLVAQRRAISAQGRSLTLSQGFSSMSDGWWRPKGAVTDEPNLNLDLAQTRRYRLTEGFVVNIEQEITSDLGAFFRFGFHNPNYEAWAFSDASRSLEAGLSLKGTAWRRPNDTVGLAEMAAGIGHAAQAYFNEGGLGILAGDGKLPNYGWENVERQGGRSTFRGDH
jgi:hypothetical protein